uniref:RNA helicase n=1 Tax=Globodera pallida TaxID=36090 RepID=A0A183BW77_GLOPA
MASSAVCDNGAPTSKENLYTGNKYSSAYWKLHEERIKLPVWSHKSEFLAALEKHRCILLEAETGSGKTTQIPQWCVEWLRRRDPHKNSVVCCTQPRRLATVCVAQRVAAEMDVELSDVVGYSIRFEEAAGYNTLLKYCTDGMLLAESSRDEMLMRYDLILLDEVHERSMITDVIMGLVKRIMQRRPELRVVVMSASLKTGNFEHYFYGCRLMQIAGRSFPVKIIHSDCDSLVALDDYIDKSIKKAIDIHRKRDPGDILIFLTGQEDVEKGCEMLEEEAKKCVGCGKLNVIPLYGSMQHDQQRILMETQYDGLEGSSFIL